MTLKTAHGFIDSYISKPWSSFRARESVDAGAGRYIFLEELSKVLYTTPDPVALGWEPINVSFTRRDNTAVLLENNWFLLARRPDIGAKLKAEVGKLVGKPRTYIQLRDLKYVRWLLNESFRVYPVPPINARTGRRDTTIPLVGGPDGKSLVFVLEVAYHTWAMHRLRVIYSEDEDEFVAER
ncbi:cytochrome P450 [Amylocarpus encephaloides]|uniref:Cytochrome P450 n=1 Tax=Amylocarpus encephaloides TaxID=45428 RepID=A0A9P7YKP7_9HELO|nr:cytochrome P450 [Amylocarpus encephaloides]